MVFGSTQLSVGKVSGKSSVSPASSCYDNKNPVSSSDLLSVPNVARRQTRLSNQRMQASPGKNGLVTSTKKETIRSSPRIKNKLVENGITGSPSSVSSFGTSSAISSPGMGSSSSVSIPDLVSPSSVQSTPNPVVKIERLKRPVFHEEDVLKGAQLAKRRKVFKFYDTNL